jgi:uncharacterized Tic20 family protein
METLDQFEETYIPTSDEKTMALLSHVLTLVAGFVAPLVIFLVKKDESPFVRKHAVEALNFQISMSIYALASIPLMIVLVGFFTLMAIGVLAVVLSIVATVKASEGSFFRYPITIRLIK